MRGSLANKAHAQVRAAIINGDMPAASEFTCADCGKPADHYDHREYAKPLEVEPVCAKCNGRRGKAIDADLYITGQRHRVMAYISRGEKRWIAAEAKRQGVSVSTLIKMWIIEKRK